MPQLDNTSPSFKLLLKLKLKSCISKTDLKVKVLIKQHYSLKSSVIICYIIGILSLMHKH